MMEDHAPRPQLDMPHIHTSMSIDPRGSPGDPHAGPQLKRPRLEVGSSSPVAVVITGSIGTGLPSAVPIQSHQLVTGQQVGVPASAPASLSGAGPVTTETLTPSSNLTRAPSAPICGSPSMLMLSQAAGGASPAPPSSAPKPASSSGPTSSPLPQQHQPAPALPAARYITTAPPGNGRSITTPSPVPCPGTAPALLGQLRTLQQQAVGAGSGIQPTLSAPLASLSKPVLGQSSAALPLTATASMASGVSGAAPPKVQPQSWEAGATAVGARSIPAGAATAPQAGGPINGARPPQLGPGSQSTSIVSRVPISSSIETHPSKSPSAGFAAGGVSGPAVITSMAGQHLPKALSSGPGGANSRPSNAHHLSHVQQQQQQQHLQHSHMQQQFMSHGLAELAARGGAPLQPGGGTGGQATAGGFGSNSAASMSLAAQLGHANAAGGHLQGQLSAAASNIPLLNAFKSNPALAAALASQSFMMGGFGGGLSGLSLAPFLAAAGAGGPGAGNAAHLGHLGQLLAAGGRQPDIFYSQIMQQQIHNMAAAAAAAGHRGHHGHMGGGAPAMDRHHPQHRDDGHGQHRRQHDQQQYVGGSGRDGHFQQDGGQHHRGHQQQRGGSNDWDREQGGSDGHHVNTAFRQRDVGGHFSKSGLNKVSQAPMKTHASDRMHAVDRGSPRTRGHSGPTARGGGRPRRARPQRRRFDEDDEDEEEEEAGMHEEPEAPPRGAGRSGQHPGGGPRRRLPGGPPPSRRAAAVEEPPLDETEIEWEVEPLPPNADPLLMLHQCTLTKARSDRELHMTSTPRLRRILKELGITGLKEVRESEEDEEGQDGSEAEEGGGGKARGKTAATRRTPPPPQLKRQRKPVKTEEAEPIRSLPVNLEAMAAPAGRNGTTLAVKAPVVVPVLPLVTKSRRKTVPTRAAE